MALPMSRLPLPPFPCIIAYRERSEPARGAGSASGSYPSSHTREGRFLGAGGLVLNALTRRCMLPGDDASSDVPGESEGAKSLKTNIGWSDLSV